MLTCRFCPRQYRHGGYQRELAKLIVHVKTRHPGVQGTPNQWYKERDMPDIPLAGTLNVNPQKEVSLKDAGDLATEAKWRLGAVGVIVVILDDKGSAHVGNSGLPLQATREMACAIIHSTYPR